MQLVKSLFCLHGFDNRARYIIINFSSFVSFIILNEIFISTIFAQIISLFLCLSLCVTTTIRRLNDAKLNRNWLLAPTASFLVTGLVIIFVGHGSIYWLLTIPLLLSLLLTTYPSTVARNYILGYFGSVDLSQYLKKPQRSNHAGSRIEPTMNQESSAASFISEEQSHLTTFQNDNASSGILKNHNKEAPSNTNTALSNDIGEVIRLALFSNKNAQVTLSIIVFLLFLAIVISVVFTRDSDNQEAENTKIVEAPAAKIQLLHHINLPDNFSLMASTYNGIVISWEADETINKEIWSLTNAQGDNSCQNIQFNNGDAIRSLKVNIENNNQYFAYFSPLDTAALVKSIAFKGRFSLCGYNFSLKGSQAALGKSSFYANLIEY